MFFFSINFINQNTLTLYTKCFNHQTSYLQSADIFCLLGLASNSLLRLSGSLLFLSGTSPDSLSVSLSLLLLHTRTVNIAMTMAITATPHDVRAIPRDFLSLLLNPPSSVTTGCIFAHNQIFNTNHTGPNPFFQTHSQNTVTFPLPAKKKRNQTNLKKHPPPNNLEKHQTNMKTSYLKKLLLDYKYLKVLIYFAFSDIFPYIAIKMRFKKVACYSI